MSFIRGIIEPDREIVQRHIYCGEPPDWTDDTLVEVTTIEKLMNGEEGETLTYGQYMKKYEA